MKKTVTRVMKRKSNPFLKIAILEFKITEKKLKIQILIKMQATLGLNQLAIWTISYHIKNQTNIKDHRLPWVQLQRNHTNQANLWRTLRLKAIILHLKCYLNKLCWLIQSITNRKWMCLFNILKLAST